MKAVKCPVCEGSGKVPPAIPVGTETVPCHGCGGKGWVEVGEAAAPIYPVLPYIPIYPQPYFPPLLRI